jgi:hypothetical protein
MGAAMRQKLRATKHHKVLRRRFSPDLLKQLAELQKLRERVRLAEAAKRRSGRAAVSVGQIEAQGVMNR